ncbi:Leucine Rich repeats (2 copies) family protein [Candida parapsilosis]|uniref:Uncharacterized protein n=2 Tax=Candida parapsilosis TaxID=5480 RepID=G8BCV6_CANPC|nr:uncharacterized protein CPAR2_207440 [Candida parapsilosis]KAF6054749.1 Leucine Rich repeats (2 copies) family protein [Candida parapsilosis]KAF6056225.1 Leucine Rich repeats (2 copies) family protein [Candida parapsilosis]KAF6059158.1 Leucine Rich repeats (2 copies) family protein [Candida parapsilosis]KAF6067915.1 Leucine Rich repeats (2 copies) family protein [Candida parapsilosis]KAI5903623.1 hypothetical protein K4G60_g2778 [Candida parapsilosis]
MEKQNFLLPFAFTKSSSFNESDVLNKTPRQKSVIDENASSIYHTRRTVESNGIERPSLQVNVAPSLKRRMGRSFNDKDDIKKVAVENKYSDSGSEYEEEPTLIDEDMVNDSAQLPPSSPVGRHSESELMSEFDFATNPTTSFQVPKSPPKKYDGNRDVIKTSPQKPASSEPDFGIDRFNRYRVSFNDKSKHEPSSSTQDEDDNDARLELQSIAYNKARAIILDAFENVKTVIDLQAMNLYEVPDEIKDLNNLVIIDSFSEEASIEFPYQLYLTGNQLTQLPPSLFKFTKLQVLSLRRNKLRSIPPLIGKLVNLIDLSLSSNKLEFFPYQILQLKKLSNFTSGPNPFAAVPDDAVPLSSKDATTFVPKYKSSIRYLASKFSELPTLKTLCLDVIAKHDVSYSETRLWKRHTPKIHHKLIVEALRKGNFQDTCSECDIIVVEPMAEVLEWWDILQNKNVPIRRQFCSQRCVKRYEEGWGA